MFVIKIKLAQWYALIWIVKRRASQQANLMSNLRMNGRIKSATHTQTHTGNSENREVQDNKQPMVDKLSLGLGKRWDGL